MKITTIQLIFFINCLAFSAFAQSPSNPKMEVLERSGKHGYVFVQRPMEDLLNENFFEGKHFKIVKGKSNTPIALDDSELGLKAATVYFHLTKARKYWVNVLESEFVKNMEQMTVRLEITNEYSKIAHFKNDNLPPKYNNAYTVPGGKTPDFVPADKQDEWGMEIWFNPMKRVSTSHLAENAGINPLEQQLLALKGPIVNYTENSFTQSSLNHIFYPEYQTSPYYMSVIRHAGTLALTYAIVEASRKMDRFFMESHYYLDTAMIPEIIYHEFAHAAFSDKLEPTHATAVIEGMADYFATLTAGESKMYRKIHGYSNNMEKDALNKTLYHPYLENSWNATGDFVLSLLWKVKAGLLTPAIIADQGSGIAEKLVMEAGNYLDTATANINRDLPRALFTACQSVCRPRTKRLVLQALLKSFEEKGL